MNDDLLREVIEDALAKPPHERFPHLNHELRALADDSPQMDAIRENLNYAQETWVGISDSIEFELDRETPDLQFVEAEKDIFRNFNRKLEAGLRELVEQDNVTTDAVAEVFKSVAIEDYGEWEEKS